MSDQTPSKDDADVCPESSWEVISESDDSRCDSIENLSEGEPPADPPNDRRQTETTFVEMPDERPPVAVDADAPESGKKTKKKPSFKRPRRPRAADAFTVISIAALLLTLTGISMICFMLPAPGDNRIHQELPRTSLADAAKVQETLNSTSDLLSKLSKELDNNCNVDEEVCTSQNFEPFIDITNQQCPIIDPTDRLNNDYLMNDMHSMQDIANMTSTLLNSLKGFCSNPSLYVFLCTLMQDVCLIKLVNQLEKNQNVCKTQPTKHEKVKINVKSKAQTKKVATKKTKLADTIKPVKPAPESSPSTLKSSEVNKTKSECEKRFEELENKWSSLGKTHLLKIQEIKEQYRTEHKQLLENQKEEKRKQKIKLLRDNYIQKLKTDRERYLQQLRKIKDERRRALNQICSNNNTQSLITGFLSNNTQLSNFNKNHSASVLNSRNANERRLDLQTENALIEEIVRKVMYNLSEVQINNTAQSKVRPVNLKVETPSNSTHEIIEVESFTSVKNTSNQTKENSDVPFGPLPENFSFTNIAKRNNSKKEETEEQADKSSKYFFIPAAPKTSLTFDSNETDPLLKSTRAVKKVRSKRDNKPFRSTIDIVPTHGNAFETTYKTNEADEGSVKVAEDAEFVTPRRKHKLKNAEKKTEELAKPPPKQDIYNIFFDHEGKAIMREEENLEKRVVQKFPTIPNVPINKAKLPAVSKKVFTFKGKL